MRAALIREPFVSSKYKTRQLCRQVQRALNLALAERASGPGLDQLYVVDVTSDFGCGHLFVHFSVPANRSMPDVLASLRRAAPRLRAQVAGAICRKRAGTDVYAGGVRGSHFAELQADEDNRLWLMVHSGSRAMGPAVTDHHLNGAELMASGLRALDANSAEGQAYLNDAIWARNYAAANRRRMAMGIAGILGPRCVPPFTGTVRL